jgi:uncharacterized protein involved in exopolysaccharide biosynthesis
MEPTRYKYPPDEPSPPVRPRREDRDVPEEVDVWGFVLSVWNARRFILVATIAAAIFGAVVSLLLPKSYEAIATVFVTPPAFASQLTPPALSVEAYERLARSDYIRNELTRKLRTQGLLGEAEEISKLDVLIYSSHEPQKPYLPLLGLVGTANNPAKAQAIANAWADIFVQEGKKLAAVGKSGSVDFILSEFPKTRDTLHQAERRLGEAESQQESRLNDLKAKVALPLLEDQMRSRSNLLVALEEDAYKTRIELGEAQRKVSELERQLAQTPQVVTMSKAMSDDALWQIVAGTTNQSRKPADLVSSAKLSSETLNPVHTEIAQELARARGEAEALKGRSETLRDQIAVARQDADRFRRAYFDGHSKIGDLERDQRVALSAYQRDVDQAEASFKTLGSKIGDAQIAKVEHDSDIKLGALAEVPRFASSPSVRKNVALTAVFAFLLSILVAAIRDQVRQRRARAELVPLRSDARV